MPCTDEDTSGTDEPDTTSRGSGSGGYTAQRSYAPPPESTGTEQEVSFIEDATGTYGTSPTPEPVGERAAGIYGTHAEPPAEPANQNTSTTRDNSEATVPDQSSFGERAAGIYGTHAEPAPEPSTETTSGSDEQSPEPPTETTGDSDEQSLAERILQALARRPD